MAAAAALFTATLAPGAHVVMPRVLYWGMRSWLLGFAARYGIDVSTVDDTDRASLEAALRPGITRWVWLETRRPEVGGEHIAPRRR